jgi:hypothetical protein
MQPSMSRPRSFTSRTTGRQISLHVKFENDGGLYIFLRDTDLRLLLQISSSRADPTLEDRAVQICLPRSTHVASIW